MKAAIVGAGSAGLLHALCLRAQGVAVAHVFDPDRERAESLAALCAGRAHATLEQLAASDADLVSICSPPTVHVAQAARCAQDGRIVFVEKPVAVSTEGLERLARLPGCVPVVQWRVGRAILAVRRAVAERLLGPAPTVSVDLALHRDAAYFARGRGSRRAWGCGALLSVGIHALDALCFVLDRPVVRTESALGPASGDDTERAACVLVTFAGGALATVRITFEGGGPDEIRMSFCGAGVTASVVGTETDPTATHPRWKTGDSRRLRQLEAIEARVGGYTAGPLLVPYLGRAVQAAREGARPGDGAALPGICDVQAAHRIALQAREADCAQARGKEPDAWSRTKVTVA